METTFENAKVGDRACDVVFGWGDVVDIQNTKYPIVIDFESGRRTYTFGGKEVEGSLNRSLFWDEIKITPPPRPKRMVKKKIEGWVNVYRNHKYGSLYPTKEIAEEHVNTYNTSEACVKLTGEYEVEE